MLRKKHQNFKWELPGAAESRRNKSREAAHSQKLFIKPDGTTNWPEISRIWIDNAKADFPGMELYKFIDGEEDPTFPVLAYAEENLADVPPEHQVKSRTEIIKMKENIKEAKTAMFAELWDRCDNSSQKHVKARAGAAYKVAKDNSDVRELYKILRRIHLSRSTETATAIIDSETRLYAAKQGNSTIFDYNIE